MQSFHAITPGLPSSRRRATLAMLSMAALPGLNACSTTIPQGLTAVAPFDVERYQGTWYEIVRLDHGFERGLSDVTASYRLQPDGSLLVVNRGYDAKRTQWREVTGRASFVGENSRGSLKVSFFGPFYGGYHVMALDQQHYRWAMVVGPSLDYFWILARDKHLPATLQARLLDQAKQLGVDTQRIVQVEHTRHDR
jgi:apolipoprotein D and lipocalin family protein